MHEIRRLLKVVLPGITWNPRDVISLVHEAEAKQRKIPEVPYKKMAGEISKTIHLNRRCNVIELLGNF